ncbi:hypothetical protein Pcinc_010631 [Petrolisthes cinctipes]|uniref:Uncharacterized protein n=1 Tax=Petrolisthes cinctipes TaxID=88211 RepID=A0AAE1G2Y9_PETCI|nr:hypothetical protein Pcinc_010631 [Petrolisthes cinctipes]
MTPRYSIPHATSCRISTRPHPPRYDMHTLPTQPPHPSHLTITRPLNARQHMTLYSTRTPQILRPRSSGRATSALRTFSTLAYARLSTPLTSHHTGLATSYASGNTTLHKQSHHLVLSHHTSALASLRHSHTSSNTAPPCASSPHAYFRLAMPLTCL